MRTLPRTATLIGWCTLFLLTVTAGHQTGRAEAPSASIQQAKSLSSAFRHAAQSVAPAVVTVVTKIDRYRQFRDGSRIYERLVPEDGSIGSGVIIHDSGVVLTNSHVLEGADRIIIRTADGREFETYDINRDAWSDVAILRVKNPPRLKAARLGNSNNMEIGDWVIAIGSPFELEATVSAGIISGKNRGLEKIRRGKLLQTDAAINPGNSGGPLVNLDGEVIGINTAIASSSGGYQGIGFAIPINNARWIVNQLASNGKVRRAYLGVSVDEFLPRYATQRGLPPVPGVVVTEVRPDTAAAKAGLMANDVIVEFAGMPVRDIRDLQGFVEQKPVGSRHSVKIIRDGQPERLEVTVQGLPEKISRVPAQ